MNNSEMPVLVICYNNHPFVAHTIEQLRLHQVRDIIVIDNASTWGETQRWLSDARDCYVIKNAENFGHLCWQRPEVLHYLPDLFAVTDPDLQFNDHLPSDFLSVMAGVAIGLNAQRVGFALDISDAHLMFPDADYHRGRSIVDHEKQFWSRPVNYKKLPLYLAPIDTTFHVFNKLGRAGVHLRIAGNFTARHLPWYLDDPIFGEQEMARIYRHATKISTIARLRLRHSGLAKSESAGCVP